MKNIIAIGLLLFAGTAIARENPNFVFFLSDDQLKADYGCYGLPLNLTPVTDQLAKEGLVFDRMFTAQAICAPSRSVLFTGQYPIRNGCFINHTAVRKGTRTVYDALTPLGYTVSLIGKVHVKPKSVFHWATPNTHARTKGLPLDEVDSFFASHTQKPFCLFITSNLPHGPYPKEPTFPQDQVVRHPYMSKHRTGQLSGYYDHIAKKEKELETVLQLLEKHGLKEATVFIYSADHGNGTGAKFTVYDRGLNVPFIVRWPEKIKPGRTDALASYSDLLPTLVELAGGTPPENIDGKSFAHVLMTPEAEHQKHVFGLMTQQGVWGTHIFPRRSVHDGQYHYIFNFNTEEKITRDETAGKKIDPFHRLGAAQHPDIPEEELFDTLGDPWELKNLAKDPAYETIRKQLKVTLFQWMKDQGDFLSEDGDIPYLESMHPIDQSNKLYTCPPELVGTIKEYQVPHVLTEQR
ncbi:MAG: sulfatase [Chloroflexi bacterium]|nr:sulfatase [Chloroflexota bacterium]